MEIKNVFNELNSNPDGTFLEINPFNNYSIGACNITGTSPVWEMHPDTDEWFYILEGFLEITLLMTDGEEHHKAGVSSSLVVPKGIWHKPSAPSGAKFIYLTPGTTQHSDLKDPRKE